MTYTEAIITDVLCRGIADTEIQMDLLGDAMSLEQALKFIEAKEAGKRSATRLSLPQSAEAMGSSYRRQGKPPPHHPHVPTPSYCGTTKPWPIRAARAVWLALPPWTHPQGAPTGSSEDARCTFNTCEHQPLPLMDGPPLRLMIDSDATPTAHHSPIPVPLRK